MSSLDSRIEKISCILSILPGVRKINGVKIISKGGVMWVKASDDFTEAFSPHYKTQA